MTAEHTNRLGILVGGGPAPGINSVIAAATIRARLEGLDVVGVRDGFQWIMQGDIDHVSALDFSSVSRTHFRGGSILGTARANPTTNPTSLENVIVSLQRLGVSQLITIGGDDTAFSAMKVQEHSAGRVRVVHVPKTIDNDLDLPPYVDTFGYQTARHYGVEVVKNLMVDARTTSRWYLVVAMGRTAGHLALGIGKAAGATITLITEEFARPIRLKTIVDTLVASIVKRQSQGRLDGVAVIAEGVSLAIDPQDFETVKNAERDAHGHIRLAEVNLGEILKSRVTTRLKELGLQTALAEKNIGYELRCADPIPFDIEYTRDLGYCAAKYLMEGGSAAMISLQGGHFVPVPFTEMVDRETGRTRVRLVDITSTRYAIARRFMVRLRRDDFEDPAELARIAAVVKMTPQQFQSEFDTSSPPSRRRSFSRVDSGWWLVASEWLVNSARGSRKRRQGRSPRREETADTPAATHCGRARSEWRTCGCRAHRTRTRGHACRGALAWPTARSREGAREAEAVCSRRDAHWPQRPAATPADRPRSGSASSPCSMLPPAGTRSSRGTTGIGPGSRPDDPIPAAAIAV